MHCINIGQIFDHHFFFSICVECLFVMSLMILNDVDIVSHCSLFKLSILCKAISLSFSTLHAV